MVEAAQARQGNQTGIRRWPRLDRASIGRVFAQRVVNPILLVIAHVVADHTAKVFFVHRDDMVEDLAAAASNPSFGQFRFAMVPECSSVQLLHDPIGRWMPCNVEVEDPAALGLDDEETVQHSEGRGRHGEEIEGDNGLAVVVKKREPFLGRITPAMDARK